MLAILVELRWLFYSGFAVAIVFFVWGYVDGYRAAEYKIRGENWGIFDD